MRREHDRVIVVGGGPVGARERNLREMASLAADPRRAYEYMLDGSMIASLRRCGMIGRQGDPP